MMKLKLLLMLLNFEKMAKKEKEGIENAQSNKMQISVNEKNELSNNLLNKNNMKENFETANQPLNNSKTENVNQVANNIPITCDIDGYFKYRKSAEDSKQKTKDNATALVRFISSLKKANSEVEEEAKLKGETPKKVRIRITPHTHTSRQCNYVWVQFYTKKGVHKFTLYLNEAIYKLLMTYISTGNLPDAECNANSGITEFRNEYPNFPLSLIAFEHSKGKKFDFIEDNSYSKYPYGMIIYNSKNNEDLKRYIELIW